MKESKKSIVKGYNASILSDANISVKAAAVLMASIMLISSLVVVGAMYNGSDTNATSDPSGPDRFVTYDPNGATYSNSTNAQAVGVGYYGIASTEYNPEFWSLSESVKNNGVNKLVDFDGDVIYPLTDWVGPSAGTISVTNQVMTLYLSCVNNKDFTIKIPNGTVNSITLTVVDESGSVTDYTLNTTGITKNVTNVKYGGGKCSVSVSISDDGSFTFKTNTNPGNYTIPIKIKYNATLTFNKVFGGWTTDKNSSDYVLPGDVISASKDINSPTTLYARWITPDVFQSTKDVVNLKSISDSSLYQLDVLTPYANLRCVVDNNGTFNDGKIDPYSYDQNEIDHYEFIVTGGDNRTQQDMFGTIFHLTKERLFQKDNDVWSYWIDIGTGKSNDGSVEILKGLPTGTYRSGGVEASDIYLRGYGVNTALLGDVIIDNVNMWGNNTSSTHGGNGENSLFANGHKLIIGTGITNPIERKEGTNTQTGPQLIGGTLDGDIAEATINGKRIVSAIKDEFAVDLGTCIIVHSGIYQNIVAGSINTKDVRHTIGTDQNPLSTYVVLKGGMTYDTVAGGFTGDKPSTIYGASSESVSTWAQGGTFVYLLGHFMPGDDWEDKNTGYGDITGRNKFVNLESSILEGGSNNGSNNTNMSEIEGSSHIFISDNASVWDAQASGRRDRTTTDYSYMEITGRSVVRHVACGTITDGANNQSLNSAGSVDLYVGGNATVANLFGAGYDTWFAPNNKSMLSGSINITVAGGTIGNVYGGGYRGSVGDGSLTVNVNVCGGEVLYDVYGGGCGGLDKIKHKPDGTFEIDGDYTHGDGYNRSMGRSIVNGTVNVTIGDHAIVHGNVYGGGKSVPKLLSYTAGSTTVDFVNETNTERINNRNNQAVEVADVIGDITVKVTGSAIIGGSVYGGGRGVDVSYSNGEYSFTDMTKMVVVNKDRGFTEIPWFTDENGDYTYVYDTGLCTISGGRIIDGRYLDFAKVFGTTTVIIDVENGNTPSIEGSVYGGGIYGRVQGTTTVDVKSGYIGNDVVGGGVGREGINAITGDRTVFIEGKEGLEYGDVRIHGSVYGGTSEGDDGLTNAYTNTNVVILRGDIEGNIFGGGLMGITYGNANVYVGYTLTESGIVVANSNGPHIAVSNIYAGGNVSNEYDSEGRPIGVDPYTKTLVQGNGSVFVYGYEGQGDISVTGSIMASGNSCLTGGNNNYIQIQGFNNRADSMTGIHRANNVLITQSILDITGRNPLVPIGGTEKVLSFYGIDTLTLSNGSSITISEPMDGIGSFRSYSKDNAPTESTSPSNELIFASGSTFYVRDVNMRYGSVTGHTLLTVLSQERYGAYVLGDAINSVGGFVISRDGVYELSDYSDASGIRCWYISGVETKNVIMNLNAQKDENNNPLRNYTEATIDIQKLQNGTDLVFTGWSFTAVSSDGKKTYEFLRPGAEERDDHSELGLIVGYMPDGADLSDTIVGADYRKLPIDTTGDMWMRGTYCTDDSSDNGAEPEMGNETNKIVKTLIPTKLVNYSNPNDKSMGVYPLNIVFTAAHSDRTTYIGYVILNIQESRTISYDALEDGVTVIKENTMVSNTIEIRVDLYVIGNSSTQDMNMVMKTETENGLSWGQVDMMIPSGMNNASLFVDNITYGDDCSEIFSNLENGQCRIFVTPISNPDNTSGWASASTSITCTPDMSSKQVGVLVGSISASLRFSIVDFVYPENPPTIEFTIKARIVDSTGTSTPMSITIDLQEKRLIPITFYDKYRDPTDSNPIVYNYYEGGRITRESVPSTGPNFIGWYYKDTDFANEYDFALPVTRELSLEARYAYVVTFDNMDGTSYTMYVAANDGGAYLNSKAVPQPELMGYEFVSWFKDRDCSRQWDYTFDRITGDTTLYAKWVGKEFVLRFWYYDNEELKSFDGFIQGHDNEKASDVYFTTDGLPNNRFYAMMKVGDELIKPTVSYGSTFNTIDPFQSTVSENENIIVNVLDFAKSGVEANVSNSKFICWEAYRFGDRNNVSYSIYSDTVLTGDLAKKRADGTDMLDYIDLYAKTATVAIELNMSDTSGDASVNIAAPTSFLSYPVMPDLNNLDAVYSHNYLLYLKTKDGHQYFLNDGGWWETKNDSLSGAILVYYLSRDYNSLGDPGGSIRYYQDGNGNFYQVEDDIYKEVLYSETKDGKTTYYAVDNFGNYYSRGVNQGQKDWVLNYSIVYKNVGGTEYSYKIEYKMVKEVLLNKTNSTETEKINHYEYQACYEWKNNEWVQYEDDLSKYYFKDRYGNHYEGGHYNTVGDNSQLIGGPFADKRSWYLPNYPTSIKQDNKVGSVQYYKDSYGIYYTKDDNDNYVKQFAVVYQQLSTSSSCYKYYMVFQQNGEHQFYEYNSSIDKSKWGESVDGPDFYFYEGSGGNNWGMWYNESDGKAFSRYYKCIYGSPSYYTFSYELNQALRPGYTLQGWHNLNVDEGDARYPSAGSVRTLDIFFAAVDYQGQKYVVTQEVLHTTDSNGDPYLYQTKNYLTSETDERHSYVNVDGYDKCPRIDDPSHVYYVDYVAKWEQQNYTVNIGSMAHGTIHAFYVDSNGNREEITDSRSDIHYGDRIELSYTPSGRFQFSNWFVTGEYILNPSGSPSTTLIVQGNCTISVTDVGDRVVNVNVKYDVGKLSDYDRSHTDVYLRNTSSGEYIPLEYVQNAFNDYESYRAYVPLGDYKLVLRYNIEGYGYDEYELEGDVEVGVDNDVNYLYYVISGRIKDATTDGTSIVESISIPEEYTINGTIVIDKDENQVFKISKYAGVQKGYIDSKIGTSEVAQIINNPNSGIPAIEFTVSPGYVFNTYEGYPSGSGFVVSDVNRYTYGTTVDGKEYLGKFHLDWTRNNGPADVVLIMKQAKATVNYTIDGDQSDTRTYGKELVPVLDPIPSGLVGWYYDSSYTKPVSNSALFNETALIITGSIGMVGSDNQLYNYKITDESGNTVSYVFANEKEYKIEYDDGQKTWYVKDNGLWKSCSEIPPSYYYKKSMNDLDKYLIDDEGNFIYFISEYKLNIYPRFGTEWKTIGVDIYRDGIKITKAMNLVKNNNNLYEGIYVLSPLYGYGVEYNGDPQNPDANDGLYYINVDVDSLIESIQIYYVNIEKTVRWESEEVVSPPDYWHYENGAYSTQAKYGMTIELPTKEGIIGWNTIPENAGTITKDDSSFKFTLKTIESNVELTAIYDLETVDVTFITYEGTFSNGYQSITVTVAKGDPIYAEDTPIIRGLNQTVTFNGFKSGDIVLEIGEYEGEKRLLYNGSLATFNEDSTYVAQLTLNKVGLTINVDSANASVSATKDSSSDLLIISTPNVIEDADEVVYANYIEYGSEIIIIIKPVPGKTLDYDNTIQNSNYSGVNINEPKKLSEDRGFRWSFLLTDDVTLNLQFKVISVGIDFYLDGEKIDPSDSHLVNIVNYRSGDVNTTGNGQNIPMYSTITTISNYDGSTTGWYTDPGFDNLFETNNHIMTENISLYTHSNYVIFLYDHDGSSPRQYRLIGQDGYVTIPDQHYDLIDKHKNQIHIGWATKETINGVSKNSFDYILQDRIPVGQFETSKRLDLFAYYLTDGSFSKPYNGEEQRVSITNAYPDIQDDIQDTSIKFNFDTQRIDVNHEYDSSKSTPLGMKDAGSQTGYYWMEITSPKTSVTEKLVGDFTMVISPFDIYVIAPTAYKIDDGMSLEVHSTDVRYYSANERMIPTGITVVLEVGNGYGSELTGVGVLKTKAKLTGNTDNFAIHYIDGMICIYPKDSAKSESWGYTESVMSESQGYR